MKNGQAWPTIDGRIADMNNTMTSRDFADLLAIQDYWFPLIEYQVNNDEFDSDEFVQRLIIEAEQREIELTDLDDFVSADADDYWWELTAESVE